MKEKPEISYEIWMSGEIGEVSRVIQSLQDQGFETIEAVCKAFNKKRLILN